MIGLEIQSPSLDRLRARWSEAPAIVREELAAGMRDATNAARDEIKSRTPVRTGALRSSIVSRFTQVGSSEFRGEVSVLNPGAVYVRFVEDDTRAHVIRPRFTQALRFSVGGRVVFARAVNHPGTTGQHFFRDGAAAAAPRVRRIFSARLGQVTRRLGRR